MNINFFDIIKFDIRIVYPIAAGEDPKPFARELGGGDGGAVCGGKNDLGRNYCAAAEKTRLFRAEAHLKREVSDVGQITIHYFATLTLVVGELGLH